MQGWQTLFAALLSHQLPRGWVRPNQAYELGSSATEPFGGLRHLPSIRNKDVQCLGKDCWIVDMPGTDC
jgi:hypothetical protein